MRLGQPEAFSSAPPVYVSSSLLAQQRRFEVQPIATLGESEPDTVLSICPLGWRNRPI